MKRGIEHGDDGRAGQGVLRGFQQVGLHGIMQRSKGRKVADGLQNVRRYPCGGGKFIATMNDPADNGVR